MIEWIAFDADDTLWENEKYYYQGQKQLTEILAPYQTVEMVEAELLRTETNNLPWFGYRRSISDGIKSFGLSMIETAIRLSAGAVGSAEINTILDHIRNMLKKPAELLPGVLDTLETLRHDYRLMVITKGDLLDQERKLAKSGLEDYFEAYEVVSDKLSEIDLRHETYARILNRHAFQPNEFVMVGNSLRSDILPVISLGGYGVYVPHKFTWAQEQVSDTSSHADGYIQIESIKDLPLVLEKIKHL